MADGNRQQITALVEKSARRLMKRHGARAVLIAIERLNKSIDRHDWRARDFWAQVVHILHHTEASGDAPTNSE
jgi:hypothetical protein